MGTHIRTIDKSTGFCVASGDPHYQGFDRKSTYHRYDVGTYIMTTMTEREFEVQTRLWPCGNGQVTCNCGVAVREDNDIIIIDLCHGNHGHTLDYISLKDPPEDIADGTQVTMTDGSSATDYVMYFPSGSIVTVNVYTRHMNIRIEVPGDDYRHSYGICGNFDGDETNDFEKPDGTFHTGSDNYPDPFFESWRYESVSQIATL
ncbi:PREDICTED: von Willebrand factor D and EGF domain-containing protein-like [Branchiostoma belcheri]|uniref:von Willebrand factor D and EGF domain-containing protein-like n=1 Tax=Branchiostoma belcheri TaxID=7741 RepID=A0A6P4YQU4_BRABE|nr:PREDICTED: von Willebrand factor D and EGF domain-containing protein-like [Branchiostoma belcheri]